MRRRWLRIVVQIIEIGTLLVAFPVLLLWCSVPATAPLTTRNPSTTAFIELRRTEAAAATKSFALKWQWKPIDKISRYLRAAVIYAEDYNFYRHHGVDWSALRQAASSNWMTGALKIGGSTITQQLAKNLYLSPSRSFVRKIRELWIANALEDDLSKQRILELYLNVVEWGDGVFGAEAASRRWFGHSAAALTPVEAARLAIALPNPRTRAPNVRDRALTKKAARIIRLLHLQGLIDAGQEQVAYVQLGVRAAIVDEPDEPAANPEPLPAPAPESLPAAPDATPDEPAPTQPGSLDDGSASD